jgi:hypothetical protein
LPQAFFPPIVDLSVSKRRTNGGKTMQFLLLIYENEQRFSKGYDEAEMSEYQAFGKEFAKNIKGGNALQATGTAKTVRVRNGKPSNTDGPFAETKE